MDMSQFDPPGTLDYLAALSLLTRAFPIASSHGQLLETVGSSYVTDVSDLPVFQQMEAADPLPSGYSQRIYQFVDAARGRGILEAAFHLNQLVNVRIQLFFQGWFAKSKARKYLVEELVPSLELKFGPAQETTQHHAAFRKRGLVVVARYVPGTPSVSTYLMHEDYAYDGDRA